MPAKAYAYVGPSELWVDQTGPGTCIVTSAGDLHDWLDHADQRDNQEPFTFVVDTKGRLRVAPRRSEHVACAGGEPVLSAGEMTFRAGADGWSVVEVSNQSTGYCPAPDSWPAVAAALDRLGIEHPGDFTGKIVFRWCPQCGERNIVHDDTAICAVCDSDLDVGPDVHQAMAAQRLLDALCVELGFCLPPLARVRLRADPPVDAAAFAHEVFAAEGLDPSQHQDLYQRVADRITRQWVGA